MQHVCNEHFWMEIRLTMKMAVNTNLRHLELYSILGEYDNVFPLAYCLQSTLNAKQIGKQKHALEAWAKQLQDRYGVLPVFVHVDKDMAKIAMSNGITQRSNYAGGIYIKLSESTFQKAN